MEEIDDSVYFNRPTIVASANQCLDSFQKCLVLASEINARELSMVEDQFARFSTWAGSIGVFARGHASMDHRLRYAQEAQSVVTGLLESLDYRIKTCSSVLQRMGKSSTSQMDADEGLCRAHNNIGNEITQLNKISNTIRKAGRETHILKASNFEIKNDDGENVESLLLQHFQNYIYDRFPNIETTIQQRLAHSMLLRRKRILYRRHRYGRVVIQPPKNDSSQTPVTLPTAAQSTASPVHRHARENANQILIVPPSMIAPSQNETATTLVPEKLKIISSPSQISRSKTIALDQNGDLIFPLAPGRAAKRKYEDLMSQRRAEYFKNQDLNPLDPNPRFEMNKLSESDLQMIGEIDCPYCMDALPAKEVFDERKWQNHVTGDLDPYVCTFENCNQADILYKHSAEWLNHLHGHVKAWRCPHHKQHSPFHTREEFMEHMKSIHHTKLNNTQLRILANKSSRNAEKLFNVCPLCGEEEDELKGEIINHITVHLRSLALKSLPLPQNEASNDSEIEYESSSLSGPRSQKKLKDLGIESDDTGDLNQAWDDWEPPPMTAKWTNFLGETYTYLDANEEVRIPISKSSNNIKFQENFGAEEENKIVQWMQPHKGENDGAKKPQEFPIKTPAGDHKIVGVSKSKTEETTRTKNEPIIGTNTSTESQWHDWSGWIWSRDYQEYYRRHYNADLGHIEYEWHQDASTPSHENNQNTTDSSTLAIHDHEEEFQPRDVTTSSHVTDQETLDPRYCVQHQNKFQPGEIFKVLWSEPQGYNGTRVSDRYEPQDGYGGRIYVGFRRFIVIANDQGHCTCVSIYTYGGAGCNRRGIKPEKHGIIHERGRKAKLLGQEPKLGFAPVRVEFHQDGERLEEACRVNYSKLYTIEHNLKVFFIGRVAVTDWEIVSDAVAKCWEDKTHHRRKLSRE